jgi:hypothetical protein
MSCKKGTKADECIEDKTMRSKHMKGRKLSSSNDGNIIPRNNRSARGLVDKSRLFIINLSG